MANNSEYLKIHCCREKALERAILYTTNEPTLRDILLVNKKGGLKKLFSQKRHRK